MAGIALKTAFGVMSSGGVLRLFFLFLVGGSASDISESLRNLKGVFFDLTGEGDLEADLDMDLNVFDPLGVASSFSSVLGTCLKFLEDAFCFPCAWLAFMSKTTE